MTHRAMVNEMLPCSFAKVLNEYPTQKLRVNSTLLQLCADGVLFGATAPCEVCKERSILSALGTGSGR